MFVAAVDLPLSAAVNNPMVCGAREGTLQHARGQRSRDTTTIGVTVDGKRKVVVGRRLRHRAGVHRPRPQGQSSPNGSSRVGSGSRWRLTLPNGRKLLFAMLVAAASLPDCNARVVPSATAAMRAMPALAGIPPVFSDATSRFPPQPLSFEEPTNSGRQTVGETVGDKFGLTVAYTYAYVADDF